MTAEATPPTETPTPPDLPWAERPVWRSVDCGAGWYDLLRSLDTDLRALFPEYRVVQVKEKFGTLRFYIDTLEGATDAQRDAVRARITAAEEASATICEWCGQPGRATSSGWIRVLCASCTEKAARGKFPWR